MVRKTLAVFLLGLSLVCGLVGSANAQERWAVLPFTGHGLEAHVRGTFSDLLQGELASRQSVAFIDIAVETDCSDSVCAQVAGQAGGADVTLYGSLNTLGSEIVIAVTVVDVNSGEVVSSQRMTINRVEDLDTAAIRIAEAIVTGGSVEDTIELGTVTEHDAQPDIRREGDNGFGFRLGGITPLGDGYGTAPSGILFDLSFWYETRHFALEPRVGTRFSVSDDQDGSYFEVPIEIGAYYILGMSDIAGFFGGGASARYIAESRPVMLRTGSFITSELDTVLDDSSWGFGLSGRVGVLLLRTYSVRLAISVDYNLTFIELNGVSNPQSLTFGVGIIL